MQLFRKNTPPPPDETYLECYSMNGCVYRVVGSRLHYRVEISHGARRCRVAELRTLAQAHALALKLLDNGSVPRQISNEVGMIY